MRFLTRMPDLCCPASGTAMSALACQGPTILHSEVTHHGATTSTTSIACLCIGFPKVTKRSRHPNL